MSKNVETTIIFIPGLTDDKKYIPEQLKLWNLPNIKTVLHYAPWEGGLPYTEILARALELVDSLPRDEQIVVVGLSAGGSLAVNILEQRLDRKLKVVAVCSPLRRNYMWPHFNNYLDRHYPNLVESMKENERVIASLSPEDKRRILTLTAIFDEHISPLSSIIPGASNQMLWVPIHNLALTAAVTSVKKKILNFV